MRRKLVTIQSFGMGDAGGGSRIMRALLSDPQIETLSICTSLRRPKQTELIREIHLKPRPSLGRLDFSRFHKCGELLDKPFLNFLTKEIRKVCLREGATLIHTSALGLEYIAAANVSKALNIPLVLSVYDDIRFLLAGKPYLEFALEQMGLIWNQAQQRLVISLEMGEEYCERYGRLPYDIITDGVEELLPKSKKIDKNTVYFMGLMHYSYLPNFKSMLKALESLSTTYSENWKLTLRCGSEKGLFSSSQVEIENLPFTSEIQLQKEIVANSVAYLPLPFGKSYTDFVKFSLSTKMISYLASGVPILYHGPEDTAVANLLRTNNAALLITTEDPAEISKSIGNLDKFSDQFVMAARELASSKFLLVDQRRKFWQAIERAK